MSDPGLATSKPFVTLVAPPTWKDLPRVSLVAPGDIAQCHVCQMMDMVQCFEVKFLKRRQKVFLFFYFVLFFVFHTERSFSALWVGRGT